MGWNRENIISSYATGSVVGNNYVGGLVGWNNGTVEKSYASGPVEGDYYVGGLVGWNFESVIRTSYSTGTVNGINYVGGLAGLNHRRVENSYATGDVDGFRYVGGLVGLNRNTIENTYAVGEVNGDHMVGGLVGVNEGTVSDSFWDLDTTQQTMSDGGTGKTTEEMKNIDTYTDIETEGLDFPWDFAGDPNDDDGIYDIWDHDRLMNEGYPFLTWIAYSVVIEPSEGRMITAGDTIRFTAAVYDRTGNVITDEAARFKWQNATEEGVFKSTVTGDHFVTATYGSRASNIVTVAVEPGSAYTVEIEPAMDQNIYPGDTIDFDAVAFDGYGNIVEDEDAQFIWENTDEEGVFQETAPGVYLVRASYETITSNPVNVTVMGPIFDFSNLRTIPEEPVVGEEVELMIDVTNVGNEPGESTVEFIIDGEVVGSDTVEVGVGDTVTASVTYMIEKEGNHTLEAGGETIVFTAYEEDTLNYLLLLIPAVIIVAVLIVVILMKQDKINLKTGERRS